jgi:hypothetical protein
MGDKTAAEARGGRKSEEEVKEGQSLLLGFHPFVAYPTYI